MNIDRTVNKTIRDLQSFHLIKEDVSGIIRKHLLWLAVACYEEGKRKHYAANKKTVILCHYDRILAEYESAEEAARQNKCSVKGIYSAIRRHSTSHNGNRWEYKEGAGGHCVPAPKSPPVSDLIPTGVG
jgi:hypothetical protein